jgi:hypothetical protein
MVRAEIKRQKANIINARPNDHPQRIPVNCIPVSVTQHGSS